MPGCLLASVSNVAESTIYYIASIIGGLFNPRSYSVSSSNSHNTGVIINALPGRMASVLWQGTHQLRFF